MAVRDDFSAGEVLAAADLNDTFASKLPYSYGTATPSTSDAGFLWYDSNSTPPDVKFWDGSAFQALTSGKILQIVRATDSTTRSTNSTSFVDVTGMSVTITPQKSDSAIILIALGESGTNSASDGNNAGKYRITDSSDNAISGAEEMTSGLKRYTGTSTRVLRANLNLWAYATPATTSAVTYKLRFRSENAGATTYLVNSSNTGQMYAIEVSA